MECSVCCGKTPPSQDATCPSCGFAACRTCVRRFVTERRDDACCMNCGVVFTRSTLTSLLGNTWMNSDYKRHRETVLMERERGLLAATQPHVDRAVEQEHYEEVLKSMRAERARIQQQLAAYDRALRDAVQQAPLALPVSESSQVFYARCARHGCDGYLNSEWKCNSCGGHTCSKCLVFKSGDHHVCNPEDCATAEAIQQCRSCPGCRAPTHRVSGCAQMWCTSCHMAWDWNTGRRINGRIHNEHYDAWLREQARRRAGTIAREPGDIPCAGRPTNAEITNAVKLFRHFRRLMAILRLVNTIEQTELPRYPINYDPAARNLRMRVALLRGRITELDMQRQLQRSELHAEKNREIGLIMQMMVDVASDLLRQIVIASPRASEAEIDGRVAELESLVEYANAQLMAVARIYRGRVPQFAGPTLRVVSAASSST